MTTLTAEQKTTAPVKPLHVTVLRPAVDIYENNEDFLIQVEMPGVDREDVSIDLENNILSLSGVRHHEPLGSTRFEEFTTVEYRNSFSIPEIIEISKVTAKLEAGILYLTLPKLEAVKPRLIKVQ